MRNTVLAFMLGLGATACGGAETNVVPAIVAGPNQVRGKFVLDKVP